MLSIPTHGFLVPAHTPLDFNFRFCKLFITHLSFAKPPLCDVMTPPSSPVLIPSNTTALQIQTVTDVSSIINTLKVLCCGCATVPRQQQESVFNPVLCWHLHWPPPPCLLLTTTTVASNLWQTVGKVFAKLKHSRQFGELQWRCCQLLGRGRVAMMVIKLVWI
jgi:hypothetical protein